MTILALLIGMSLPVTIGWMTLVHLEGKHPVLGAIERWCFALILGPTEFCLIVFAAHFVGMTALNRSGFLIPSLIVLAMLILAGLRRGLLRRQAHHPEYARSIALPRFLRIGILIFAVWTGIKILAGAYDLLSVPTYWDDSFNNWNMRGKIYYRSEALTLEIPNGNGLVQSAGGVGSYPPTIPMLKAWLSFISGSWQEPLVNGVHLVWFVGLLGSFFFALRRRLSPLLSLAGTCALVSLPLFLIQATNPYADVFLAAHVFLTLFCLSEAARTDDRHTLMRWLILFGFCLGLMTFTKNEAAVLYAPLSLLLFLWVLLTKTRNKILDAATLKTMLCIVLGTLAILAGPWLLFKWLNGLTFGNAKAVSNLELSLNTKVIHSIWFQLSHEPNWLLLPIALPFLLLSTERRSFRLPERILTVFLFVSMFVQFAIFIMVKSLATEALMQTGLNRGLVHLAPIAMLLTIVLIQRLLTQATESST